MTHASWKEDSCGEWEEDAGAAAAAAAQKSKDPGDNDTAKAAEKGVEWTATAAGDVSGKSGIQQQGEKKDEGGGEGEEEKKEEEGTACFTAGPGAAVNPCGASQQEGDQHKQQQTHQLEELLLQREKKEQCQNDREQLQQEKVNEQLQQQEEGKMQLQRLEKQKQLVQQEQHTAQSCRRVKRLPSLDAAVSLGCLSISEEAGDSAAGLAVAAGPCPAAATCGFAATRETDDRPTGAAGCSRSGSPAAGTRATASGGKTDRDLTEVLEGLFTLENLLRDRQLASSIKPGEWVVDIDALLLHPAVAARGGCSREQLQESIHRSSILSLTECPTPASTNSSNSVCDDSRPNAEETRYCSGDAGARGGNSRGGRGRRSESIETIGEEQKESRSSSAVAKDSTSTGADDLGSSRDSRSSGTSGRDETESRCVEREADSQQLQAETGANSGDAAASFLSCGITAHGPPEDGAAAVVDGQPHAAGATTALVASGLCGSSIGATADAEAGTAHASSSAEERAAQGGERSQQQQQQHVGGGDALREDSSFFASHASPRSAATPLSSPSGEARRLCVSLKALFGETRSTIVLRDVPAAVAVADILHLILQAPHVQRALRQQQQEEKQQQQAKQGKQCQEVTKTVRQQQQQEGTTGQEQEAQEGTAQQQRSGTQHAAAVEEKNTQQQKDGKKEKTAAEQQPGKDPPAASSRCSADTAAAAPTDQGDSHATAAAGIEEGKKVGVTGVVKAIRAEPNHTWFVTLQDAQSAQEVALWLRMQQLAGQPVRVGIKATHFLQHVVSSQYPSGRSSAAAAAGVTHQPQQATREGGHGQEVGGVSITEQLLKAGGVTQHQHQQQQDVQLLQQQALQQQLESLQLLRQVALHKQLQQQLLVDGTGNGGGSYTLLPPAASAQQRQQQRRGGSRFPQQVSYGQQRAAAAGQPRMGGSTHRRQATAVVVTDGRCTSSCRDRRSSARRSHHAAPPPPPPDCCPLCWGHVGSGGAAGNGAGGMCSNGLCCCGSSLCSRSSGMCGNGRMFRGHEGFYPVYGPMAEMCCYPHTPLPSSVSSARRCYNKGSIGGQGNVCLIACGGATSCHGRRAAAPYGAGAAALPLSCDRHRAPASTAANAAAVAGCPGVYYTPYGLSQGATLHAPSRYQHQQRASGRSSSNSRAEQPARERSSHRVARNFSPAPAPYSTSPVVLSADEATADTAEPAAEPEDTAAAAAERRPSADAEVLLSPKAEVPAAGGKAPAAEAEAAGAQEGEGTAVKEGSEEAVAAEAADHEETSVAQEAEEEAEEEAEDEAAAETEERDASDTLAVAQDTAAGEQGPITAATAGTTEKEQAEAASREPVRHRWSSLCSSVASSRSSSRESPARRVTSREAAHGVPTAAQVAATLAEAVAARREAPASPSAAASADEEESPLPATEEGPASRLRKSAAGEYPHAVDAVARAAAAGFAPGEWAADSSQSRISSPSDPGRRSSSSSWRSVEEETAFLSEGDDLALSACAAVVSEWHGRATTGVSKVLCERAEAAAVAQGHAEEGEEKGEAFSKPGHSCQSSNGSTASMPQAERCWRSSHSSVKLSSSDTQKRVGAGTAAAAEVDERRGRDGKREERRARVKLAAAGRRSLSLALGAEPEPSEKQQVEQQEQKGDETGAERTGLARTGAAVHAGCKGVVAAQPGRPRIQTGGSPAEAVETDDEEKKGGGAPGADRSAETEAAAEEGGEATAAETKEAEAGKGIEDAGETEGGTAAPGCAGVEGPEVQVEELERVEGAAAAAEEPETARDARKEADGCPSKEEGEISADAYRTEGSMTGAAGVEATTGAAAAADATPEQPQLMYVYPYSSAYAYDEQQLQQNSFGYVPAVSGAAAGGEGAAEVQYPAGTSAAPPVPGNSEGAIDSALAAEYYCAYYWHQYYIAAAAAASAENGDLAAAAATVGKAYMAAVAATNAAAAACSRAAAGDSQFEQQKPTNEWRGDEGGRQQSRTFWARVSETQQGKTAGATGTTDEEANDRPAGEERVADTQNTSAADGSRGVADGARRPGEGAVVGTEGTEVFSPEAAAAAAAVAKHFAATAALSAVKNVADSQQLQQRQERCFAAGSAGPAEWKGGGTVATAGSSSNTGTYRRRGGYSGTGVGGLKTAGGGGGTSAATGRRRRNGIYAGGGHMQRCGAPDCWYPSVSSYPAGWHPSYFYPRPPPPPEQPLPHSGRRVCYHYDGEIYGGGAPADRGRRECQWMQSSWLAQQEQEGRRLGEQQLQQRQQQQHEKEEQQQRRHTGEEAEEKEEEDSQEARAVSESKKLKDPPQHWGQQGGEEQQQEVDGSTCSTPYLSAGGGGGLPSHKVGGTGCSEGPAAAAAPAAAFSTTAIPPEKSAYRRGAHGAGDLSDSSNSNRGCDTHAERWPAAGGALNEEGPASAAAEYTAGEKRRAPSRSSRYYVRDAPEPQQQQHYFQHHVYPPHYQQHRYPFYHSQLQQPFPHQQQCYPQQLHHHYFRRPAHHQPQEQRYRHHYYPGAQQQQHYHHHMQQQQQHFYYPHHQQQPYYYHYPQSQYPRSLVPWGVDLPQGPFLRGGGGGGRRWRNVCPGGGAGAGGGVAAGGDVVGGAACRPSRGAAASAASTLPFPVSVGGGFFDHAEGYMAAGAGLERGVRCFHGCEAEHAFVGDAGGSLSGGNAAGTAAAAGGDNGTTRCTERCTRAPRCVFAATSQQQQPRRLRSGTGGRGRGGDACGGAGDGVEERRSAAARRGTSPAAGGGTRRVLSSRTAACNGSGRREDRSADVLLQRAQVSPQQQPSRFGMQDAVTVASACPSLEGPDFPSLSISVAAAKLTKKAVPPLNKGGTTKWAELEKESVAGETGTASVETPELQTPRDIEKTEELGTNGKGDAGGAAKRDAAARWANFALRQQQQMPQNSNSVNRDSVKKDGLDSSSSSAPLGGNASLVSSTRTKRQQQSEQRRGCSQQMQQREGEEEEKDDERLQHQWKQESFSRSQRRRQQRSPSIRRQRQSSPHGHRQRRPLSPETTRQQPQQVRPASPCQKQQQRRGKANEGEEEGQRQRQQSSHKRRQHQRQNRPLSLEEVLRDADILDTERSTCSGSRMTPQKSNSQKSCSESLAAADDACVAAEEQLRGARKERQHRERSRTRTAAQDVSEPQRKEGLERLVQQPSREHAAAAVEEAATTRRRRGRREVGEEAERTLS